MRIKENYQFYTSLGLLLLSFLLIGFLPRVTLETDVVNPDFEVLGMGIMVIFFAALWINGYYYRKYKEGK